jgi:hypothetical protein
VKRIYIEPVEGASTMLVTGGAALAGFSALQHQPIDLVLKCSRTSLWYFSGAGRSALDSVLHCSASFIALGNSSDSVAAVFSRSLKCSNVDTILVKYVCRLTYWPYPHGH